MRGDETVRASANKKPSQLPADAAAQYDVAYVQDEFTSAEVTRGLKRARLIKLSLSKSSMGCARPPIVRGE